MHHKKHHGSMHHHRKHEMEHHAIRHSHKAAHHAKKGEHHAEHPKMHEHGMKKSHGSMVDNKHVSDNHQEGIKRVLQRHGDMEVGQHGKMGMNHKHADSFKRPTGKTVPVRG